MDHQLIYIIAGVAVVVLILRALSVRKAGDPEQGNFRPVQAERPSVSIPDIGELRRGGEVRELIARNSLIEAIKIVREETNCGLREAKDYVDSLRAGNTAPVPMSSAPQNHPSVSLEPAVRELIRGGKILEAIKLVRQHTGMDLSEAKNYVEGIAGTMRAA